MVSEDKDRESIKSQAEIKAPRLFERLREKAVEEGFAKYVEWSASMVEDEARRKLKAAELQANKNKLRLWTNYVPPSTNSKAISNNFTEKVPLLLKQY